MRMVDLRMGGALLGLGMIVAGTACAAPDFSQGITGLSEARATNGSNEEAVRDVQQKAIEAEAQATQARMATSGVDLAAGQLSAGDKVKLTVFGEDDLSGEFEIDNTGSLALPLVGEIQAKGLTPRDLEKKITSALQKGYLVNPRVNIEVLNFRPFYILGEVNKPGSYPYANDLTVIGAVALGGGYTPRAKTGKVQLRRAGESTETWVPEDTKVYPGDMIRVDERFF